MESTAAFEEVETAPVFTEERINVLRKTLVTSFQRLKCGYELASEPDATEEQRQHANSLKAEFQEVLIAAHEEYVRSGTPTKILVHYANILFQEISVYDKTVEVRQNSQKLCQRRKAQKGKGKKRTRMRTRRPEMNSKSKTAPRAPGPKRTSKKP